MNCSYASMLTKDKYRLFGDCSFAATLLLSAALIDCSFAATLLLSAALIDTMFH